MTSVLSGAIAGGGALGVIASMITPAFLILSAANLIGSTMTRLARIVDTARTVMERKRSLQASGDHAASGEQAAMLRRYRQRATLVQVSLGSFYASIGLFVAASLAIALTDAIGRRTSFLPAWLTIAGAVLLFAGSLLLFAETTLATRMLRTEITRALD